MDYLDIISPNQGTWVSGQWIARARLGLHLQLARILERLDYEDIKKTAGLIWEYLKLAGLDLAGLSGADQLKALLILSDLNRFQTHLAFLEWQGPDYEEPPYTYPSRIWAVWVHKLASRYGWSRAEIFNLWPEEAAVYIQEIIVSEYDEIEERRTLSEVAYSYDSTTKKSKFIPLARPGWMVDKKEPPKKIRVRKDMLPIGHIIKLTHLTDEDFEKIH